MEFSPAYLQDVASWSPSGDYLATACRTSVVVRSGVDTLRPVRVHPCVGNVTAVEWSPDGKLLFAHVKDKNVLVALSMDSEDWECTIRDDVHGIASAWWAPDSAHLFTAGHCNVRVSIWSLTQATKYVLEFPKYARKSFAFSHSGKYAAMVERRGCKDFVNIVGCARWELLQSFEPDTMDLAAHMWSPDDSVLCVVDSALVYKVLLYTPDGTCIGRYSAYQDALGVRAAQWVGERNLLAIASYDDRVRFLHGFTFQKKGEIAHAATVDDPAVTVFVVMEQARALAGQPSAEYVIVEELPFTLTAAASDTEPGVDRVAVSAGGRLAATHSATFPTSVFVWDLDSWRLVAVLVHVEPVRVFVWHPTRQQLAIATGSRRVFMWTPGGCMCVDAPSADMLVRSVAWSPDGARLLTCSKDRFHVLWNCELDDAAPDDAPADGDADDDGIGIGGDSEGDGAQAAPAVASDGGKLDGRALDSDDGLGRGADYGGGSDDD